MSILFSSARKKQTAERGKPKQLTAPMTVAQIKRTLRELDGIEKRVEDVRENLHGLLAVRKWEAERERKKQL